MALYADPDGPCLETSTLLAALAQETSRAKIGVLVYGNTTGILPCWPRRS